MVWFTSSTTSNTRYCKEKEKSSSPITCILTVSIILVITVLSSLTLLVWRINIEHQQSSTINAIKWSSRRHQHNDVNVDNNELHGASIMSSPNMTLPSTSIVTSESMKEEITPEATKKSTIQRQDIETIHYIRKNQKVINTRSLMSGALSISSSSIINSINNNNEMQLKEIIVNDLNDKKILTAIIHLGPPETGSSSIQEFLQRYLIDDLILDNYRLVPDIDYPKNVEAKVFTSCFTSEKLGMLPHTDGNDYSCDGKTFSDTIKIATQNHANLLYTSEMVSYPEFNERALYHSILPYWNTVHVVGYYRRYYSWITSLHNEKNKNKDVPRRTRIASFINNMKQVDQIYNGHYVIGSINRFKKHPYNKSNNYQNIHIYNLHNLLENDNEVSNTSNDVLEHFYCTAMPDAKHACEKTKEILKTKLITKTNEQHDLVYEDLVYYARAMGYIQNVHRLDDSQDDLQLIQDIAKKVKNYHINILQHNTYQFSPNINDTLICPTDEAYEYLLQLSLQAEKELFPSMYNENVIRDDFLIYRNSYKFCHIDAVTVLKGNYYGWKDFFLNLLI